MTVVWRVLLAIVLLSSASQVLALEARADFRVAGESPFWVGQRIVVEIDLLSTGFTFSNQQFDLPNLPGMVLMPPDNATLNLSESIDGETWQGMRYQLSLFVLEPGTIELPPLAVSFSVAMGYGSEPESFNFTSEPLPIEVKLPPNAEGLAGLVTTSRFELKIDWQPEPNGLKVGDALTLTVQRRAANVPGAAIPPFQHATVDGLTAYAAEPEINDSIARGDLTGERIDKITYVLQKPGDYQMPGSTLHWFDPTTETLRSENIAPLDFTVAPNPNAKLSPTQTIVPEVEGRMGFHWVWLIAVVLLLVLVVSGRWYLGPRLHAWWQTRQAAHAVSEEGYFKTLLAACQGGNPVAIDQALTRWIRKINSSSTTATTFAASDTELAGSVAELQRALAEGRTDWSGKALARVLQLNRQDRLKTEHNRHPLPALNPSHSLL